MGMKLPFFMSHYWARFLHKEQKNRVGQKVKDR
jgi:hypothetical protein